MFKPMLAPNDKPNLDEINYPLFASTKLDGIRCIFKNGEILSRSLKQIQCKQLREKFESLRLFSLNHQCILDGEIYSPELSFQQITHFVMTQDLGDEKIPESLTFYCFDYIKNENYNEMFTKRIEHIESIMGTPIINVKQVIINNKTEVENLFEKVLGDGYEGLILKSANGKYKTGRGTLKEGLIYKVKPFETFDAQIIGVVQATEANEDAEKKINELGRSVTSKKKGDRHNIDKASAFVVKYNGLDLKVTLAMTDAEKENVWHYRETYLGKTIEYRGMLIGSKNLPRHPTFIRFREDKE